MTTWANAPSNREQRRMLRFGSLDVDTPKCRILFGLIGTDGGVQLLSRTSTTRSLQMSPRLLWASLCFWTGIETVPYCLDSDLFAACSTLTLDALVLEMAVDALESRGWSALVRHNFSSAYFLHHLGVHHLGVRTVQYDVHQCRHAVLLGAWELHRASLALAQSKPWELQLESAWG